MKNLPKSTIIKTIEIYKQQIKKLEECLKSTPTTIEVPAHKFEVYHEDVDVKLDHWDAVKYCKGLGDGWRLPTRKEKLEMYDRKEELGLKDASYWSSTENGSTTAFNFSFTNGTAYNTNKNSTLSVRAVRTIKD